VVYEHHLFDFGHKYILCLDCCTFGKVRKMRFDVDIEQWNLLPNMALYHHI
jgi:hypothetical protein